MPPPLVVTSPQPTPPATSLAVEDLPKPGPDWSQQPTVNAPLGVVVGARSGDKGANANLGVFVREAAQFGWLDEFLTVDRLKDLLPEVRPLTVHRYRFPNLNAVNFVIEALLEEGVAACSRQDRQAKALGEWLRSRVVPIPASLL